MKNNELLAKRRLPEIIATALRERITDGGMTPGDRLPGEWLTPEAQGVSRGTLREALKILQCQGLITSKTGPHGGIFVRSVSLDDAIGMLDNLFLFRQPSINEIYAIRKIIEPILAAEAAANHSPQMLVALRATTQIYQEAPTTAEEEYEQRLAELNFHAELARNSIRPLFGFINIFLLNLLRSMTVCRAIYKQPNPKLRKTGLHYQMQLLHAIQRGNVESARTIMSKHMKEAEKYMLARAIFRQSADMPSVRHPSNKPAPSQPDAM